MEQVVVWCGTIVGKDKVEEFEEWLAQNGFNVSYLTEFKTLPSLDEQGSPIPNTGGRNDLLFSISSEHISKFAVWRLGYKMHWWEDYLDSGAWEYVPSEILETFPYSWGSNPHKYTKGG